MGIQGRFQTQLAHFNLNVDFRIPSQGVTAIFGASGAGKTVLLRCIAGLERAMAGFLAINEQCWQDESRQFFLPTHRRAVGYVFQEPSLFTHLSVRKNLEYGLKRILPQHRHIAFDEAVTLLGISTLLPRRPHKLSGGERQRVAIARALLTSPKLLLMDEPLAALDIQSKAEILSYLEKLHATLSIPILYVTHALEEVMRLADTLMLIEQGQLRNYGPLAEMLTCLDSPLAHVREAGAIIEATVVGYDERFHLLHLDFGGEHLSLPTGEKRPLGQLVRVNVNARDVSLILENRDNSSILNVFTAKIIDMAEELPGQLLVKLEVKGQMLLARITQKSAFLLNLQQGMKVYAQVKSVGCQL